MAQSVHRPSRKHPKTGKTIKGRYYHGQYRLEGDEDYTRLSLRVTDKRVAEKKLAEIVEREERRRAGILAPAAQLEAARTLLADHLSAYLAYQASRQVSRGYTRKIEQRVTRLIAECGWERVCEVSAPSFIAWRNTQALSPKTLNDYQHAISTLLNWLRDSGRISTNPLEHVGRVDGRGKKTFRRRAFTDAEAARLLAVHPDRRRVYLLALHTGLRLSELRALQWADVDLEAPMIRLRAEATKAKRADVLPITLTAQAMLAEWRDSRPGSGRVFPRGVPNHHTFRADLEAARIPRLDDRGWKVDFHALRVTFITNLQRAGVPQRIAMALARHTDPRLTAHIYTDQDALPLAEAVAKLPTYADACHAKDAHGRTQELVSGCPQVSQADAGMNHASDTKTPVNKAVYGVIECHPVAPDDTAKEWSRGESNPRAETVSRQLLRA